MERASEILTALSEIKGLIDAAAEVADFPELHSLINRRDALMSELSSLRAAMGVDPIHDA